MGLEIHPETPPEGVLLAERLPGINWDEMYQNLRHSGAPFGIVFGHVKLLSNSRLALEASEYARDKGLYEAFHTEMFHAYFTKTRDIGKIDVVMELAASIGLDTAELKTSLQEEKYVSRLQEAQREAEKYGVSGVPTFMINKKYKIVGAQPLEVFHDVLRRIS